MEPPQSEEICPIFKCSGCIKKTYGWGNDPDQNDITLSCFFPNQVSWHKNKPKVLNLISKLGFKGTEDIATAAKKVMDEYVEKPQKLFAKLEPVFVKPLKSRLPYITIRKSGIYVSFRIKPKGFKKDPDLVFYIVFIFDCITDRFILVAQHNHH